MQWLEKYAPVNSIVFSTSDTGMYIPGITGQRVFLGHGAQTVDFGIKQSLVKEFFAKSTNDVRRQQILQQYNVNYIFYGPTEQSVGNYTPANSTFLTLVFSRPRVKIYAVCYRRHLGRSCGTHPAGFTERGGPSQPTIEPTMGKNFRWGIKRCLAFNECEPVLR